MLNILSVAEKPSVARELTTIIAGVPHDALRRNAYSHFNPVFDIEACMFQNRPAKMKMTSVSGHLMEIEFDAAYKTWGSCNPIDLFTAPVRKDVKEEFSAIKRTLVQEARACNVLLLWLDCDLEGENIAFEVMTVCLQANPRMEVYRARFSALIDRDIKRTMQFPERPNPHMNDAVDARQEIDLRIGAAFTRFQTMRLQKKYENLGNQVISYGPCQFPTLGFVVDRDLRIKAFRPDNFWYLSCDVDFVNPDKDDGSRLTATFHWDRTRVYDKLTCAILLETCVENSLPAVVTSCTERPTSKHKPLPMNTVDLQKRASRLLRIGSERTMAVAEALYQRGILSYPRTETDFFKEGFELVPLLNDHRGHSQWGAFATHLLDANGFEAPRVGKKDDQAHPPIHPTKCVELRSLDNDDERKIYELVARHFLACCSRDARGSQTKMSIAVPRGGEVFSATGLMVAEKNFLEVYGKYDSWHGSKIPKFAVNQEFVPKRLDMLEGRTCPPEPINEADLINLMDTNGIGTDATIAAHITTIQTREYVVKDNLGRFVPTKLGLALVEGYNSMGYQLNKPQLRAAIEADCKRVSMGQLSKAEAIQRCLDTMRECFVTCNREATKLDESMTKYFNVLGAGEAVYATVTRNLTTCGVCHNGMDLRVEGAANARGVVQPKEGGTRFLHCAECVKSHVMPAKGELSPHHIACALCGFLVLNVKNPETKKVHTICPHCFSVPPAPPVGVESSSDFRCFMCAKEDCELSGRLAGGDVDITACSEGRCQGTMRVKRAGKGAGLLVGCSVPGCKSNWWLPKFVRSCVPRVGDACRNCQQTYNTHVLKLQFSFILAKAPPFVEPECSLCPSCDPLWARVDQPALPLRRNAPAAAAAAAAGTAAPGRRPMVQTLLPGARPPELPPQQVQVPQSPPRQRPAQRPVEPPVGDASFPQCKCQLPTVQRTTSKPGPNYGRQFFTCSKGQNEQCGFFQWSDAPPADTGHPQSPKRNAGPRTNNPPADGPMCKCKCPGRLLTSRTQANDGRKYFTCGNNKQCDFFQWAENR